MGRHSSGQVAPQSRGRHRAPSETGKRVARVAAAGVVLSAPVTVAAGTAHAEGFDRVTAVTSQGFDRDAIIACESGGDARAQNGSSSASGLYQFIDSTWRAYGGSTARAKDASVAEQHRIAARAFAAEGYRPWNASKSCWSGKLGSGASVSVRNEVAAKAESKQENRGSKASAKAETTVTPKKAAPKKVAPKKAAPKEVAPKQSTGKHRASDDTHRVRAGDTLTKIADRYDLESWREVYEQNRDKVSNPNLIYVGQVLDVDGDK